MNTMRYQYHFVQQAEVLPLGQRMKLNGRQLGGQSMNRRMMLMV